MAGLFYIFHGDDSHAQRETLERIKSKVGDASMVDLNTTVFAGRDLTLAAFQHACNSVPFLASKRLVVVEDLLINEPSFLDELLLFFPQLPDSTRLVLIESKRLKENHPLLILANSEESGYVKLFEKPEGASLERWVRSRVADEGGTITPRAVHLLAINVGNNLELMDHEIEKLILYKDGQIIKPEDVTLLCPYVAEASIFDLVDALSTRNGRIAARILNEKIDEGTDPHYLFAMFIRQFRLLIQAKEMALQGSKPAEIAEKLKIHGFVAGKVFHQSQNFSHSQLEEVYRHLLDIDVAVKTSKTDLTTAISLLVAGVTG
ncbi:MAG: DNA polymerase III subunit delta [Anaerolineae bacterium]|nr:MAG: DNA polymerase III subunit delta [Anaerolineae bacterium]